MDAGDETLIAEILMTICFVPIALWLLLTGWEYAAHRWIRPWVRRVVSQMMFRYRRDRYFRDWRANYRVLR